MKEKNFRVRESAQKTSKKPLNTPVDNFLYLWIVLLYHPRLLVDSVVISPTRPVDSVVISPTR